MEQSFYTLEEVNADDQDDGFLDYVITIDCNEQESAPVQFNNFSDGVEDVLVAQTVDNSSKTLVSMKGRVGTVKTTPTVIYHNEQESEDIGNVQLTIDGGVIFQCFHCDAIFATINDLEVHMSSHNDSHTHDDFKSCVKCNYHLSMLNDHLKSHITSTQINISESKAVCLNTDDAQNKPDFPLVFSDQDTESNYEFHEIDSYTCDLCGLSFKDRCLYKQHYNDHDPKAKVNQCALCPAKYRTLRTLKLHLFQTHNIGSAFKCDKCDKVYAVRSQLQTHIDTHEESKTHYCVTCGKYFQSESLLKRHIVTHNKRFQCSHCHRLFLCESKLNEHVDSHEGKFAEICQHCGKRFTTKYYLFSHMVTHSNSKDYQCTECGAMFARKAQLTRHSRMHKRKNCLFVCSTCHKTFSLESQLKKHIRLHETSIDLQGIKLEPVELVSQRELSSHS